MCLELWAIVCLQLPSIYLGRKRYDLAETEFIAAKLELHSTSEAKELLSEHLCNVIQQNEIRKAKKLAELLQVLNVESGVPTSTAAPLLPPLLQRTPTPGLDIWPNKGKVDAHKTSVPVSGQEVQTKSNSAAAVSGGAEEMPAGPRVHQRKRLASCGSPLLCPRQSSLQATQQSLSWPFLKSLSWALLTKWFG